MSSTTTNPFPVPSGQYPPFAVVTDTDHSAWIIIATALSLSCILIFSVIKIFIRWTRSPLTLDEAFLAASTILAIIQSSVVLGACADGLGKSIELVPDENRDKIQQMYYVSTLFFVLSLGLSKISVAFLLLRLTPQQQHRRAFYVIVALIATWMVVSTFAVALQCNLSHPWILIQETCPGAFLRWQLISAFDIAIELCMVAMAIYLVWSLQTSLENKVTVVSSFAMRLPLIIAIGFRLANFDSAGLTTNPTLLQDKFIVWTQTELSYSIMGATIPSLRPFIKTLATNYGANPANGYGTGYGTGYGSNGYANATDEDIQQQTSGSYQMSSLRPKGKGDEYKYHIWSGRNGGGAGGKQGGAGAGGKNGGETAADAASVGSGDSQRMIIKKDVIWEVVADAK